MRARCNLLALISLSASAMGGPSAGAPHLVPERLLRQIEPAWAVAADRYEANARELANLPPVPHSQPTARLGYHSAYAPNANVAKWVQVDLGENADFDAVVLIAAEAAVDASPGPGYGFPLRFRVEVAEDEHFTAPKLIADYSDHDFANPGTLPIFLPCNGSSARYVRVTATRLWSRGDRWLFALGELMVLRGPRNLAAARPVLASDGYNATPAWEAPNATDGYTALGPPVSSFASSSNGWHSDVSRVPDAEKWVQVTLPDPVPLDEVRLYPAGPSDFPTRSGFGFPVRFRVETSTSEDFSQRETLFDSTMKDFINPGENPVTLLASGGEVRAIRVTATRLWERTGDYVFALAELEAWSNGMNMARHAAVSFSDVTLSNRWQPAALVDGATSRWQISGWSPWLAGLSRRRELAAEQATLILDLEGLSRRGLVILVRWASLALGLTVVGIGLWHRRSQRKRALAAAGLRERIAADLHDEIGSQLASIALLSQVAQRKPDAAASTVLCEIQQIAEETSTAMRDIVWLIRPSPGSVEDLIARIREIAGRLLGDSKWELVADSLPRSLPLDVRRHLYLFAREALRNAAVHAHPREVHIRFTGADGALNLEIADDGTGFHRATPTSGTGLVSLQQRATALGGKLMIETAPGQGTRLILVVPASSS